MNSGSPIYTKKTECQDCYKCIRECLVKAIKVEDGHASVIPELCILCGHCVDACPHGAKRVRDDVPRMLRMISGKEKVIVSLAPSFITEFPGTTPGQMISALRKLGVYGVSETAIGAEVVSSQVGELLESSNGNVIISSACPTAVEFLRKYTPHHTRYLTALSSPLLAHARLLRNLYGDDIGIVFIGPCIAKKLESDNHPELVNVALTFEDLRRWFEQAQIDPASLTEGPEDVFIPRRSREGALYPVEGGMIDSIRAQYPKLKTQWVSFSGVRRFEKALAGLEQLSPDENLFLELLSCYGGCVNGPKSSNRVATVCKRYNISQYALPAEPLTAEKVLIADSFPPAPVEREIIPEAKLREVLKLVGKFTEKDELNCGGCGYDSCREFARAFLHDKAERTMCVTYMRALAQKKANVLIQKIPSAIVIVDQSLKIVECNPHFAKLFGPPVKADSELPILEGTPLDTALPFIRIFESVLRSGEDMIEKDLRFKGRILHALIFNIEKGSLVGALFEDITKPAMHREQIVKRARHVIQQNLKTVQNIAYLLGENAADSEIILNSIVESYKPEEEEPPAV